MHARENSTGVVAKGLVSLVLEHELCLVSIPGQNVDLSEPNGRGRIESVKQRHQLETKPGLMCLQTKWLQRKSTWFAGDCVGDRAGGCVGYCALVREGCEGALSLLFEDHYRSRPLVRVHHLLGYDVSVSANLCLHQGEGLSSEVSSMRYQKLRTRGVTCRSYSTVLEQPL